MELLGLFECLSIRHSQRILTKRPVEASDDRDEAFPTDVDAQKSPERNIYSAVR
jgi:hypothetical protein